MRQSDIGFVLLANLSELVLLVQVFVPQLLNLSLSLGLRTFEHLPFDGSVRLLDDLADTFESGAYDTTLFGCSFTAQTCNRLLLLGDITVSTAQVLEQFLRDRDQPGCRTFVRYACLHFGDETVTQTQIGGQQVRVGDVRNCSCKQRKRVTGCFEILTVTTAIHFISNFVQPKFLDLL